MRRKPLKKKFTSFRPRIRSRHPSHSILRAVNKTLPLMPFKSVIRFGSTTELEDTADRGGNRIELNTTGAIKNSSNKLLMKQCFTRNEVTTAQWFRYVNGEFVDQATDDVVGIGDLPYPIISKNVFGSRGRGNVKHDDEESLLAWLGGKQTTKYIFERFSNFSREYRLHVSPDGCFYTCRKMLKRDTPDDAKWYRNDDHCVWIMQENDAFDRPVNWDAIVEQSVNALNAVGLDFGAVDLRIQSATNKRGQRRENPDFIVVEINSAPSFGEITTQKYIEELPKLLTKKYNTRND